VTNAIQALAGLRQSELMACSSLYLSAPMGPQDQPDFINTVVCIDTGLSPEALLDELQAIEKAHHRVKTERWGPRTLDLDILLYGDQVIDTPALKIPHPGIAQRNFVLYPLAEIDQQLEIPGLGNVGSMIEHCPATGLTRTAVPVQSVG
jgi:2-amino-4-hydroxy-6-hydroxymethyldihydropteridine diphosphokinase